MGLLRLGHFSWHSGVWLGVELAFGVLCTAIWVFTFVSLVGNWPL